MLVYCPLPHTPFAIANNRFMCVCIVYVYVCVCAPATCMEDMKEPEVVPQSSLPSSALSPHSSSSSSSSSTPPPSPPPSPPQRHVSEDKKQQQEGALNSEEKNEEDEEQKKEKEQQEQTSGDESEQEQARPSKRVRHRQQQQRRQSGRSSLLQSTSARAEPPLVPCVRLKAGVPIEVLSRGVVACMLQHTGRQQQGGSVQAALLDALSVLRSELEGRISSNSHSHHMGVTEYIKPAKRTGTLHTQDCEHARSVQVLQDLLNQWNEAGAVSKPR